MRRDNKTGALRFDVFVVAGDYVLELENTSDKTLSDVALLSVFIDAYDDVPRMKIEFDRVQSIAPQSKAIVQHQVYISTDNGWEISDWYLKSGHIL